MGAVLFTGCMSAGPTIAEEDLPYGATMRETKTTFALPVSYDRRFLNDAQVTVLTDYFSAVQANHGHSGHQCVYQSLVQLPDALPVSDEQ
jgi:hypothetical protein